MIKLMRKLIFGVSAGIASLLSVPSIAFAAGELKDICDPASKTGFNKLCLGAGDFGETLGNILNFVFIVAIVAALGWLIYGAFKWILSGGDKTAVEEARNHITAAIVGLVIVFLSYFVLNFVIFFFTGTPITAIDLPTIK